MADKKDTSTNNASKETTKRAPAKPSDVKSATQEAKDLRALTQIMSQKNSPDTSKDITVFAKETLKMVAKSQKSESAAFRREATKSLIEFRNFVEQTTKVTELRRSQLLSKIDGASLDTKNATMMLLSVAKTQAKNIKLAASREAAGQIIKAKEFEKNLIIEATSRAKALESESKLKSVALKKEQEEKFKALAAERSVRYKDMMSRAQTDVQARKLKLQQQRDDNKAKILKNNQEKIDFKKTTKDNYDTLKLQLQTATDARKTALDQQKAKQQADNAQQQIDLKNARAASTAQIKKIKTDLRDNYKIKMAKGNATLLQNKQDQAARNKTRMIRLRQLETDHKINLKKIIDDAKIESILKKRSINEQLNADSKKKDNRNKKLSEFGNTVKAGVLEANPLLQAAIQAGSGLFHGASKVNDYRKDRKEKKAQANLNKLSHPNSTAKVIPSAGATTVAGAAGKAASGSGGMFGGMIGGVSNIISGIMTFFGDIAGGFGKLGGMLLSGARFVPIIAGVAAIVGSVWKFIEGFNDATSLFGDKVEDDDYVKRIFSGFTNVFGSILGIFDKVAGWLGFDTDLEGSFRKGAVKLFNTILDTFKSVAGGLASLLEYIPGMGGIAKTLKSWSDKPSSSGEIKGNGDSAAAAVTQKTQTVQDLKDDVNSKKNQSSGGTAVIDNSVQQNSTTYVQGKLDTRNSESSAKMYGGASGSF